MKSILILLLAIVYIPGISTADDVVVHDPILALSGHYRSVDGRVCGRKFPVEINLCADGTFEGTFESWIEERLTDGSSNLSYSIETFSGIWTIEGKAIDIIVEEEHALPQCVFRDFNGMTIRIERKKDS